MPLTRTTHWATREFSEFLRAHRTTPFAWGTNDCALFAANAIQAFTGVDIAADFRGVGGAAAYTDEASALALIAKVAGGKTVADAAAWCAAKHGLVEWTSPLLARRGDLVVLENAGRLIAGVIHANGRWAVSVGDGGMAPFLIQNLKRAWHV